MMVFVEQPLASHGPGLKKKIINHCEPPFLLSFFCPLVMTEPINPPGQPYAILLSANFQISCPVPAAAPPPSGGAPYLSLPSCSAASSSRPWQRPPTATWARPAPASGPSGSGSTWAGGSSWPRGPRWPRTPSPSWPGSPPRTPSWAAIRWGTATCCVSGSSATEFWRSCSHHHLAGREWGLADRPGPPVLQPGAELPQTRQGDTLALGFGTNGGKAAGVVWKNLPYEGLKGNQTFPRAQPLGKVK